jgi:xylulokinase
LRGAGTALERASFVGGGSRSEFWGRLCATALGFPLDLHEGSDLGAALGAARLARLASGTDDVSAVCSKPPVLQTFEPQADIRDSVQERYGRYRRLYQALKAEFQA